MDGHCFDTGPTLFLMPRIYLQTFADLGERLGDHLELHRIDPTYRVHFDDGSKLELTSDLNAMQEQLEAVEPGSFGGFLRYLSEGSRHQTLAFPNLIERNFRSLREFCTLRNLLLLFQVKLLTRHYDHIGTYFRDQRLKSAFTFQDMYLSLSPYKAPATFSLLPYAELSDGVWFPAGGMYAIAEALTRIAEGHGVRFMYGVPVERIDVDGSVATGVTLADGHRMAADVVVANADLPYVYAHLLPDDGTARRLERKKYACSAVTFYWAVEGQVSELLTHTMFLSGQYRQGFESVLRDLTLPDQPSFYVHAPTRVDPSLAPDGRDTIMAVVPVGHIDDAAPQDWMAIRERARRFVLRRLAEIGVEDLDGRIKFEVSYTPPDWLNRYNLTKGSALGLGHNLTQMGYLRPHNRHARYRNLYFVGASTHPGNGVATVLISARLTTERILEDSGVRR
jgi:phytoene desaturase